MLNIIPKITKVSEIIKNQRTIKDVAIKVGEEVGEVMAEVSKITGHTKYKEGEGLIEEVADAVITLIDLLWIYKEDYAIYKFAQVVEEKLDKWETKYNEIIENERNY